MLKILFAMSTLVLLALAPQSFAQNRNTSTQTPKGGTSSANRATATPPAPARSGAQGETTVTGTTATRTRQTGKDTAAEGVIAAFDSLIEGIRRADVNAVTSIYWNSPQLILFNNNGTVTKGWEQMRKNRESSYPQLKDVKIEVRDRHVQMLGRDGAVVTCLWTQSQNFRGTPETASGRMTLVFRRTGTTWKAVHLHTSPDAPDATRVLPSEQTTDEPTPPATKPTPKPKGTP
jgi:ketosteroid isomerase-like protein